MADRRLPGALGAVLLLTAAAYSPVLRFGLVSYDDPDYLGDNTHVQGGLRPSTILWAFRSLDSLNWHPLTWLSHALDWQLFGARWGAHHATSVLLHLATVAAVFVALRLLTGSRWRSLAVAAVFAVHPINVQSVAWLSERKNVLSGLLFASTLAAYAVYARRPRPRTYLLCTLLFALGLMAKPTLVTLPFVLLLLDAWPLGRLARDPRRAVVEKLPWLAMSAADAVVTWHAQANAFAPATDASLASRVCGALGGYLGYLEKLAWPVEFAVLYPKAASPCLTLPIGAAAGTLFALTAAAALTARRRPYLLVGWLWFLGMMVPSIGIVQVGLQAMADRYAYLPMLGLLVALCWGLADAAAARPPARAAMAALAAAVVALFAWRTSIEVRYWRDSVALYSRALEVTGPNCVVTSNLAVALRQRHETARAWTLAETALAECPTLAPAHANLATLLLERGDLAGALPHLSAAAELEPFRVAAQYNLGLALWYQGRLAESTSAFERALRADPQHEPSLAMLRRIRTDPAAPPGRVR